MKITTKYKVEETGTEIDNEIEEMLYTALVPYLPQGMTFEEFSTDSAGKTVGKMESYKVSPTIADNIKRDSFWAVLGSMVAIFLYILIRFKRWQFGVGAIASVLHERNCSFGNFFAHIQLYAV